MTTILPNQHVTLSTDETVVQQRRRRRLTVGAVAVTLLVLALLGAWAATPRSASPLDPDSPAPRGARAAAEILRDQGIPVQRVTDRSQALASPAGSTIVVAYPQLLSQADLDALAASPADVVLLGAPSQATRPVLGITTVGGSLVRDRDPVCALPAAVRAGRALMGGTGFALTLGPGQAGDLCYPDGEAATLVQVRDRLHSVTVVGASDFVTNDRIADEGNAALALDLMGAQPTVVWWLPTLQLDGQQSLTSLLPDWVWLGLAQLVLAVALVAWWRGRRLGRVVVEPLPVVVRATETTEGRARLYQRNRARDAASRHLREAAAARLLRPLHLPAAASPEAVVAAVASRTGRPAQAVQRLLYGPTPGDDAALVDLAHALDALEKEVRPL